MPRANALDGTSLYWEAVGAGPALLLISGQSLSHHFWDSVVTDFARSFRVIVYDHRGIGESGLGDRESYTTRRLARDAIAVLDAADVPSAHVYGFSMGGRVGQWLAIDFAGRVDRLVLGATTGGDRRGHPRSEWATKWLVSGDHERLQRLFFSDAFMRSEPALCRRIFEDRVDPRAKVWHYRASCDHDAWDRLTHIGSPTLVIHGDQDHLTPHPNGKRVADSIPNSRFTLRRGMKHGVALEDRSIVAEIIAFLTEETDGCLMQSPHRPARRALQLP